MTQIKNTVHWLVDKDLTPAHGVNQVNVKQLRSGEVVTAFNEQRFPYHRDTGQTVLMRSWMYRLMGWVGTYVLKSTHALKTRIVLEDGRVSRSHPIQESNHE